MYKKSRYTTDFKYWWEDVITRKSKYISSKEGWVLLLKYNVHGETKVDIIPLECRLEYKENRYAEPSTYAQAEQQNPINRQI